MNAKLIIALCAALLAASTASAAERFGRDSVYATQGEHLSKPYTGAVTIRNGRDSVYATQQSNQTQGRPVAIGSVTYKAGRA
jgi:hypothetical protein